ncbi:MAG: PleD family two-component system response regulator [Roseovarius sp.]
MRILVVDDEKIFVALLKEYLKDMGFSDVTAAYSGEDALAIIEHQSHPFDCLLLDINMEGIDGIELCWRIREMPSYRVSPIIMITSGEARVHMHDAFEAGATDYMAKPIEYFDLRVRIQIAMLLVETLQREAESRLALQTALQTGQESGRFDPGMRITFSEIAGMRDYFQLENRLLRLSEEATAMTLLSVEINGLKRVSERLSQTEFLQIVKLTAQILSESLPAGGATLSYVGYGKFVCLIAVRNQIVPNLLQARIRESFATFAGRAEPLASAGLQLDVAALSQKRMMTPDDAIRLMRRYVRSLGTNTDVLLPPINNVQDRLFLQSKSV